MRFVDEHSCPPAGTGAQIPPKDQTNPQPKRHTIGRNTAFLAAAQLFSGIGIASGIAVGGLLAESLTGSTEFAGFSQTASILGAAIAAIPLAGLARRYSRRRALATGFGLASAGALCVLGSAALRFAPGFFVGMLLVGVATATGLQSRYAATDGVPARIKGRMMSMVVWATTIGSVAGPNLSEPGADLGKALGLTPLSGPFVISICAFAIAALLASRVRPVRESRAVVARAGGHTHDSPTASPAVHAAESDGEAATGSATTSPAHQDGKPGQRDETGAPAADDGTGVRAVLGAVARHPRALFGLITVITAQMMMSSVMVMTPVHMAHDGMALHFVGIVISLHILGMYGLSPIFGWLADKFGGNVVVLIGFVIFAAAFVLGIYDAAVGSEMTRISVALTLLGVGWSACFLGGSLVLNSSVADAQRVPLQGLSDSLMNFGAAIVAGLSGPLLAAGGFALINIVAACLLAITVLVGIRARFGFR